MRPRLCASLVIVACVVVVSCGGPATPTAEEYYKDAKMNLAARDYNAALKNLDRLISTAGDQPLGQQGKIVRVALLIALADGNKLMADAYTKGMDERPAAARYGDFSKMRSDYYGMARVRLMDAMETVMKHRASLGANPIALDMAFPDFSGREHDAVDKIRGGYWTEQADRYSAELESNRNALAKVLARLAGAGDDVHKGHAAFEKGGVQIDPRVFLIEVSTTFMALSEIFDKKALDDPRYLRTCHDVIVGNLDALTEMLKTKPDTDMEAKVKKMRADCAKKAKELGL